MFRDGADEREQHIREQLGLEPIEDSGPPDVDNVVGLIFESYMQIERSRRYTDSGHPMPLTIGAINDFLACRTVNIPIPEFVASLFAIDDVWLTKRYKKLKDSA